MSLDSHPDQASPDERSLPQSRKQEDRDWKYQTRIRALATVRGIREYTIPDSDFNNSHGEMVHRELRKARGHERKAQKHLAARPKVEPEDIKDHIIPNSDLNSEGETKGPEVTQDKQVKVEEDQTRSTYRAPGLYDSVGDTFSSSTYRKVLPSLPG
ncbi:hypothetical protein BKA70DRAFT_1242044 [Coprinopsis sp. MPI-PUGE-AT-0042]|nr:hypothetical protein BKA70DRAFT_1242044 [Coprinopsis sp. MPI-PUGE-AT-0042]